MIDDSTIVIGANDRGVYILRERTVSTEECIPCKKATINALYSSGKLKFNIPSQEPLPVRVEIFTIDGKKIYFTAIKHPNLQEIEVKLPSGVYFLVLNGKRRYTAKFVSVN
uniref:T9SS type A sorting domain-containing protein n=1 Tax=candidate division WOR-3 bacterium TaxID=2052148 RepID=A0A7V3ZZ55_UNCW3